MDKTIEKICTSLDELSEAVINGWTGDQTFTEAWGWNCLPITRHELASIPELMADKLRSSSSDNLSKEFLENIIDLPRRINLIKNNTVTYLYNGHNPQATQAFISAMDWIRTSLDPLMGWQILQDNNALPNQLAKRLRSIEADLNEITPKKDELAIQIKQIKDAKETAESLPIDFERLKEIRTKIDKVSSDSSELFGKIDNYHKSITEISKHIDEKKSETDKLVEQCEEAYRITTTKGLAASFDQRAKTLSNSMWIWVGGLVIALVIGAWIGSHRLEILTEAMKSNTQWNILGLNILLSILSIGAPLWFAWLSTKQINQRFRLTEDYAFKASVAKAYEGYRKEAARIDVAFEARLFSSALTRLEEAPLRLTEHDSHGSPWHELISSKSFETAMGIVPELKNDFVRIVKDGMSTTKSIISKTDTKKEDVSKN